MVSSLVRDARDFAAIFEPAAPVSTHDLDKNVRVLKRCTSVALDFATQIEKAKFAERDTTRKPLTTALENLKRKLTEVEESVYQVKNRSGQDPLNFPIKLNNKIAHLSGVIESADARPTDQTYAAFKELSDELVAQLDRLNQATTADVEAINSQLQRKKIAPLPVAAKKPSTK